jgi:PPIC-type PPIASE domain/SurA N-terminal domain
VLPVSPARCDGGGGDSSRARAGERLGYAGRAARPRLVGVNPLTAAQPVPTDPNDPSPLRMPWLLLAGAALGLALAAFGLLEPPSARRPRDVEVDVDGRADAGSEAEVAGASPGTLPLDTAAIVGDREIRRVDYERMLAAVEKDLRNPIDEATRRRVLERLIDEELLVQQALRLGLAAADRRVRGELVAGIVDSVVAEVDGETPTPEVVAAHYAANHDLFAQPGRLRIESVRFADADRAALGREALVAGESTAAVEERLGVPAVAPVPDALLPLAKLRDYVGPAVVEGIGGLEVGRWSEPIGLAEGFVLVRIHEREAVETPPLAEIEALVRRDLLRRRGDEALRRYLDALREEIAIVRNETIFETVSR